MNEKSASKLLQLQARYDELVKRRGTLVLEYDQMADGSRAGREHLKVLHRVSDSIREVEAEMDKIFDQETRPKLDTICEMILNDLVEKRGITTPDWKMDMLTENIGEGRLTWVQPSSGNRVIVHVTVIDHEQRVSG